MRHDDDDVYILTPLGCLMAVLMDYGIDISHITPKMGEHMVSDFMQYMVDAGHIEKAQEGENDV